MRAGAGLHLTEHLHGDGAEVFAHACKLGCEGIVSKRVGSRYVSGRTDNWVKVKNPSAGHGRTRFNGAGVSLAQALQFAGN
jgi:ATP-dependent DNA ligase